MTQEQIELKKRVVEAMKWMITELSRDGIIDRFPSIEGQLPMAKDVLASFESAALTAPSGDYPYEPGDGSYCKCSREHKPGQTLIWCCNVCGLPDDKHWSREPTAPSAGVEQLANAVRWVRDNGWIYGKETGWWRYGMGDKGIDTKTLMQRYIDESGCVPIIPSAGVWVTITGAKDYPPAGESYFVKIGPVKDKTCWTSKKIIERFLEIQREGRLVKIQWLDESRSASQPGSWRRGLPKKPCDPNIKWRRIGSADILKGSIRDLHDWDFEFDVIDGESIDVKNLEWYDESPPLPPDGVQGLVEALEKIASKSHADVSCSLEAQDYTEYECGEISGLDYCAQIAIEALTAYKNAKP